MLVKTAREAIIYCWQRKKGVGINRVRGHFLASIVLVVTTWMCVGVTCAADAPDFNTQIRPILSQNCFECHGPDEEGRKGHLRLDSYEGATAVYKGSSAVNPSKLDASELITRITSTDSDEIMPPSDSMHALSKIEVKLLTRWVESGAEYDEHWAFLSPKKKPLPKVSRAHKAWRQNPIDAFVLQSLKAAKLDPMPEASKTALLRRVTFDLTGLPPSLSEIEAFLSDRSRNAYEKVVDRLLASDHYGERMTLAWMDAARYGDSSVMHADGPRMMWPWRDWVIKSYNDNKPFDQFTVEQLAGDLMPEATEDQKLATGFNRNHATSDEGGAFPEELRVEYVVDRVKTTANVWLGLSMECSQCHDHKFDPISNEEYYNFFAFFNNNSDPGMQSRRGNQAPLVKLQSKDRDTQLAQNEVVQADLNKQLKVRRESIGPDAEKWAEVKEADLRSAKTFKAQPAGLQHHIPFYDMLDKKAVELISGIQSKIIAGARSGSWKGNTTLRMRNKDAVDYQGVAAFVEVDKPFTMSAWLKTPVNRVSALFSKVKQGDSDMRGFDIWIDRADIGMNLSSAYPDNTIRVMARKQLKANAWQHVAVTYDGSSKAAGIQIFVDGKAQKFDVEDDSLTGTIQNESPFRIGGRYPNMNFEGEIDDIRLYDRVLSQDEIGAVRADSNGQLAVFTADRPSESQSKFIESSFLKEEDSIYKKMTSDLAAAQKSEAQIKKEFPELSSMIMQDNPDAKMRMTYVLERGLYDSPKTNKVITAAVPSFLPPMPDGAPANRLGLAKWLVRSDHPLTARVTINRYWTLFFGGGIVETVMDFGNQGSMPSHSELLDYLAVDFVESGWDVKRMIRLVVTSQTYRQSSRVTPKALEKDPRNRMLARGTRFRLQGEFIRDNALAVSGLLIPTIGGASVKPYQPLGIWNEVSLSGGLKYPQDKGDKLFRRSMYTYWKRSAPAPNMMIFDAPTREKCVVKRPRTNTPLQALVTLNDMHFVEASRKLSERVMTEGGVSFSDRVDTLYRLCMSRPVTAAELEVCRSVYDQQFASFEKAPESARSYLSTGESSRDEQLDLIEHAAFTVLANMILNLDEVLTRG